LPAGTLSPSAPPRIHPGAGETTGDTVTHSSFILFSAGSVQGTVEAGTPGLFWCWPFVCLLLAIAIFPLVPRASHWWESNRNKLLVSLLLAGVVCAYHFLRAEGPGAPHGTAAVAVLLRHSIINDFIPFIVLLFSLYTISGGIRLSGDIPAHPATNAGFLFLGAVLANIIGTTGASVLLVRPLLQINSERKNTTHTFVFFIFLVSNIGGCLLPIGDPPLFLGYLRGVPFLWTLRLFPLWITAVGAVLAVYVVLEILAYRKENPRDIQLDETQVTPLKLDGRFNFALLAGVVLAVAVLVPGEKLPLLPWTLPNVYLREIVLIALAGLSLLRTPRDIHKYNEFSFGPIAEVACLFLGIFITMQIPIEILRAQGAALGITSPLQFFWASGSLSSFLDNAPTYVVFFELAGALPTAGAQTLGGVATATGHIPLLSLLAISAGSVFMGANSYIGNGPNFLVKSIAESRGVRMPSFLGYMVYSALVLLPVFAVLSLVFFR
jgi:Na+/H+ antiporter NhaD/arsenite permease-like protein